jgi:lipoprotein-anchoring transpeptidase ErfK/SrfK
VENAVRPLRTLWLVLVVSAAALLSGGAAGGAPTADAFVATASGLLPDHRLVAGQPFAVPASEPVPAIGVVLAGPVPQALPEQPAAAPQPAAKLKPKPKPAGPVAGTPCRATASACVDLSANRAWLISNGKIKYGPVPITHGRKGFRTPPGTFRVSFKKADHVSSIYDADMPYSVFFNGGIAFHQGSLKQLSHGCIHLSGKAARTFFAALGRGEVVQVVR